MNRYARTRIEDGSQRFFFQRFPNSFANWFPYELDSPKFVNVHDVDGTITSKMGTWIVPNETFHTYGLTGCVFNSTENGHRCPPFYEGYGYLNIKNMNTGTTDYAGTVVNSTNPWIRSRWFFFLKCFNLIIYFGKVLLWRYSQSKRNCNNWRSKNKNISFAIFL